MKHRRRHLLSYSHYVLRDLSIAFHVGRSDLWRRVRRHDGGSRLSLLVSSARRGKPRGQSCGQGVARHGHRGWVGASSLLDRRNRGDWVRECRVGEGDPQDGEGHPRLTGQPGSL